MPTKKKAKEVTEKPAEKAPKKDSKKVKEAKKDSPKKTSPKSKPASTSSSSSGLGVLLVVVAGVFVVGALLFAAQNNKTKQLESEVSTLEGALVDKLKDIKSELVKQKEKLDKQKEELNEQKEEQEKVKMEVEEEKIKIALPKTFGSEQNNFSFRYPADYVVEQLAYDIDDVLREEVVLMTEADSKKQYPDTGDPVIAMLTMSVYDNSE